MLYELLWECLNISYETVGISANYATRTDGDTLYIFFEASNGKNDWKINLDFPAKPYKRMGMATWFAHSGFLKTWKEIEPFLIGAITNKSVKNIVITGYSHGAAITVLCHEYVWFNRPDLREHIWGYGFGAPRVFWGVRTEALMRRWERFTVIRNIDDAVTHVPPAAFGYSHVGKILAIGKKSKYSAVDAHRATNILAELRVYEKSNPSYSLF